MHKPSGSKCHKQSIIIRQLQSTYTLDGIAVAFANEKDISRQDYLFYQSVFQDTSVHGMNIQQNGDHWNQ
jgi:hypothetical protein